MSGSIGNFFMKAIINSPLYPLLGNRFAVITFKGRKTGRVYSTPINVLELDGVLTTISMRARTWWRNLGDGRTASLRRNGSRFEVRGDVITDLNEVTAGLASHFCMIPGDLKYFHIRLGADGKPEANELEHVAGERVIVRFHPV